MPYQERQIDDGSSQVAESSVPVFQAQEQPNNARTVQIIIAVGLVAAIIVAVFGSY